jgi:acyl-CoA synthetase (AMP-forming)/AMP-acid ligase II
MPTLRRLRNTVTPAERRQYYLDKGLWNSDTLAEVVARHAQDRPTATAVVDRLGERRVSYAELDADANRVAAFLAEQGVEQGDVVAVQLPNWYETVTIALGIFKLGAVINPMLPVYRGRELRHMLRVGETKVIFTPRIYRNFDYLALVEELRDDTPNLRAHVVVCDNASARALSFDQVMSTSSAAPKPTLEAADVSELIFTSGTEADPKAIMHTEQTTNFSVRTGVASLGMGDNDVIWMPSPIGHSTGFNYGVRFALYCGLKLVLQDRWDGAEAADLVAAEGCTYTLAATTFLLDFIVACDTKPRDVRSMRLFGCGGAPVPPDLVRRAAAHGIGVLRLYGSTEVLVGTWNRRESPLEKRLNTDGVAVNDVEVVCHDESGRDVLNEPGEIYTRGPDTCVGFFDDPDRTVATFDDQGWVKSGDLAVIDADGYLTVVGRKKEILIRGGLNVAPREVEEVILGLPQVAAVAVIGLPDSRLGEVGCACVVLRASAGLNFEEMTAHLRQAGLAQYKWPERLEIVPELPMTPSGKVRKHVLVASLSQG